MTRLLITFPTCPWNNMSGQQYLLINDKKARFKITSNSKIRLATYLATSGQQQNFQTILKDWLSRCSQNNKTVAAHITHLKRSLVLLLKIFLRQAESCNYLSNVFHLCLCLHFRFIFTHYIWGLTETMSRKFREISKIRRE